MRNPFIHGCVLVACLVAATSPCLAAPAESSTAAAAAPTAVWIGMSLFVILLTAIAIHQYLLRKRLQDRQADVIRTERDQATAQLAQRVVHDVRNLFLTVDANAELISQELPTDHQSQANLSLVRDAVRQGNLLAETLLQNHPSGAMAPPLTLSAPASLSTPEPESPGAALAIDSDPLLRAMFVSMLRQIGYESSGAAAFEDLGAILDTIDGPVTILFQQPRDSAALQHVLDSLATYPLVRQIVVITEPSSPPLPAANIVVVKKPFRVSDLAAALAAVPA